MSSVTSLHSPLTSARRWDVGAIAIVVLAIAFRLYRIDVPFVDAHSWRQVTNVDIARLWAEGPINLLYPSVSWGGPDGRVGLEFPLLHLLIALGWRVFGAVDAVGRLVPAAFSVLTVWFTYRLGARLFGVPVGRGAAFLMAVSPSVVYFGRTPLSDVLMLCGSVGAVLGYLAYAQDGRRQDAVWGALALALAGLTKLPAVLVLGPALWTGLSTKGLKRTLADPWYVSSTMAAVGAIGVWYLHADQIYLETGLTQAIFRPSGTYPAEIGQYSGIFTTVSHWTTSDLLSWQTARELIFRYWTLHLTPLFSLSVMLGFVQWQWPLRTRSVVDIWALAALSLVVVSLRGQLPHEFHQLPTMPPLALYFGMGAAPLFALRGSWGAWRYGAAVAVALVLTGAAVHGFKHSGVVEHLYRVDNMNDALINAGNVIGQHTPADALVATIEYDRFGTNSPMLLYYSHRKGWSFDATSISVPVIEHLRDRYGVRYVALTDWPTVLTLRSDVAAWLVTKRVVVLPDVHDRYRLFDITEPAASAAP